MFATQLAGQQSVAGKLKLVTAKILKLAVFGAVSLTVGINLIRSNVKSIFEVESIGRTQSCRKIQEGSPRNFVGKNRILKGIQQRIESG